MQFDLHIAVILPEGSAERERHIDGTGKGTIGDIGSAIDFALRANGIDDFHSLVVSIKPVAEKKARPLLRVV